MMTNMTDIMFQQLIADFKSDMQGHILPTKVVQNSEKTNNKISLLEKVL